MDPSNRKIKPTIKDVARLAGVSFKTVSRVINGEPSVGEKSQKRVWEAVRQLNYHPNLSARHLRGAPSSIGLIYDNPNSSYVIDMQQGLLDQCRKKNLELVIHPCDSTLQNIGDELLQMVTRSQIGGLVITPPLSERPEIISLLSKENVKYVLIVAGSQPSDVGLPCVYIDDETAAFNVTQHLIDLGHKRISFLGGDEEHKSSEKRLVGYNKALKKNGIQPDDDMVLAGHYSFESGMDRAKILIESKEMPTAIFACNDEIAAGAMIYFQNQGLKVPDDISVAGFEDNPFARHTWPRLTTARQNNIAIAQSAAKMLITEINQNRHDDDADSQNRFEPQLVVRGSTGPCADRNDSSSTDLLATMP